MPKSLADDAVIDAIRDFRKAAAEGGTRPVVVDGKRRNVPYPYPSPTDWRDGWIYFLMVDRFNNPSAPPRRTWNRKYGYRQGGTFKGIQEQLGYIEKLGAKAVWLSPVLRNSMPPGWEYNYHGYGIQDFLAVDERFASDGTRVTAEREFADLVAEAHARGLYVILDVVLNHAARVFDYERGGETVADFANSGVMNAPLGQEPSVQWLNGYGSPRADWRNDLPSSSSLSGDDAVWPEDLQRREFFRRRGSKLTDDPGETPGGFVRGDFGVMRQLVVEYDAQPASQASLRERYGKTPVLSILIRAHEYLVAKYDVDGFRIDTVKYVHPSAVETFGNALREFALGAGKKNFFTFGEVWEEEKEGIIANFVGRNSTQSDGYGIDAALDFPLFNRLRGAVKGLQGVETVRRVFEARKSAERELLSSHGEAGRFFVTFIDNHDQKERFLHPRTPTEQLTQALGLLFTLQGIPCVYYGTEQGLKGTEDDLGNPVLDSLESVREALWGKNHPYAFDKGHELFRQVRALAALRAREAALRYGRLYFREASGNGGDFGVSAGKGGLVAFSRILSDREVAVVANTHWDQPFQGFMLVDPHLHPAGSRMEILHSNLGRTGGGEVQARSGARFYDEWGKLKGTGDAVAAAVEVKPGEVQILG